jgi:hypothetical protein
VSTLIQQKDFDTRFVSKPIVKIGSSYKKIIPSVLFLPVNSAIHFIPETSSELGVDKSFSLLRNHYASSKTFHVTKLHTHLGNPSETTVKLNTLKVAYHRGHLEIKEVSNLDRSLTLEKSPLVVNYSMLGKLYEYKRTPLAEFNSWSNIRSTMWDNIRQIGTRRSHFIKFRMPLQLPTKAELNKYVHGFTSSGMSEFYTKDGFDLLELWQVLHPSVETPVSKIDEVTLENTYLVFIESGVIIILSLGDLVEWAVEDYEATITTFHKFLDSLIGLRSPVDLKELEEESHIDETGLDPNCTIVRLINEHGANGNLSSKEQVALLKLSQRYKTIADPHGSGKTLDQMVVTHEDLTIRRDPLINDAAGSVPDSMKYSSLESMERDYLKNVMPKHIVQMVLKLQDGGIIIKDMKAKQKIDAASKTTEYTVSSVPIAGEAAPFKLTMPIVEDDGTFTLGGTKYRLDRQKGEMPIVKTKPNIVGLGTYYGKLFITRTDASSLNISKWINKVLLNNDIRNNPNGTVSNVLHGSSKIKDKVPRVYSAIAELYRGFTISNQYEFTFSYLNVSKNFTEIEVSSMSELKLTPCGRDTKSKFPLGMDDVGKIYVVVPKTDKSMTEHSVVYLGTIPNMISEDLGNGPIEYTEIEMFSKRLPIVIAFFIQYGIEKTFKLLHVNYRQEPTNTRIPYDQNEFLFKCKDTVFVIDISNPYRKLIIGGLHSIRDISNRYKSVDYNNKQAYASIFTSLGLSIHHVREVGQMWDMFIDPISEMVLKIEGQPTNFKDLLLYASDLLIDDHIPNTKTIRYKGYERIAGMMYRELVLAMRTHRAKGSSSGTSFTINPRALLLSIQQDQTIMLVEESNPIHNLKEKESFTHSGSGGRSGDTMMTEDRGFKREDFGTVSIDTKDSGQVGVSASLTADPNFENLLGMTKHTEFHEASVTSSLSTSFLLSPGASHDDGKRINFISIQNSHTVACDNYEALSYRTGYEEVLGARADELFAVSAIADGVVTGITKDILTVLYSGNKKRNYDFGIKHGVVSGTMVAHNRVTDMVVGQKFKKSDILIFDAGFFQRSELNPNNVIYKHGILANVALVDNSLTNEDGAVFSSEFAKKMYTTQTKAHYIVVDFDSVVHNLVQVGMEVDPETIMCTLEGFVSEELHSRDPSSIKALATIGANNPKAKVYGKITFMDVVYYGKLEDMHSSLQAIASKYDNLRGKKVVTLDSNDAKTGRISESIRVGGVKLEPNQMVIRVFIDSLLGMEGGDKYVVGHQLKGTVSSVATDTMMTEDGRVVDLKFANLSVSNRIVEAIKICGMMNEILRVGTLEMIRIYKS